MTTQNNGSMTALEAGLEAVLFAAGDAVTIERLSAALEAAPAELLDAAAALENRYDFENRGIMLLRIEDKLQLALYFDNRILLNEFMPVAEQKVNLQGTSLNDIWEHLALQVAQLTPRAGLTPASVIANAGRRAEAEAQIAALTKKMFAEKQARKKLTLREAINKLKNELEDLQ